MTIGTYVKNLRIRLNLTQETLGAQGFVSTPGWIKIENGQRQASEKMIDKLRAWLVRDRYLKAAEGDALRTELLLLKYAGHRSGFVRELVAEHANSVPGGLLLIREEETPTAKPKRGRPTATANGKARK